MKKINLTIAALILVLFTIPAISQTPEERGKEIAVEAKIRDTGWHDNIAISIMTLRNKQGQESVQLPRAVGRASRGIQLATRELRVSPSRERAGPAGVAPADHGQS